MRSFCGESHRPAAGTADWTTLFLKADKQGWTVLMEWLSRRLGWKPDSPPLSGKTRVTTIPAEWASSPPHLAVLQRFLSPRDARTGVPDHWEPMFGTHPRNVVDGLLAIHLLEPASLLETIEFCHTGAELKKLLKERGLKASGRKAEQAQRLLDADPEGMRHFFAEHKIVCCTPAASRAVETWLDQQAQAHACRDSRGSARWTQPRCYGWWASTIDIGRIMDSGENSGSREPVSNARNPEAAMPASLSTERPTAWTNCRSFPMKAAPAPSVAAASMLLTLRSDHSPRVTKLLLPSPSGQCAARVAEVRMNSRSASLCPRCQFFHCSDS